MSKLQRNSPTPLHVPKKKGKGDEGIEAIKNSSTIVGQPELKNSKQSNKQLNDREDGFQAYTD